ncbi:hypothetical protein Acr_15g0011530 [Actinidia rufa]|uniref:RRM domain-containing protein n=1 Tax=Actinidia rufa TaxID=165716 RepID=A0A7J0FV19_9ERIC|nr:hypothetical protein Acr_15g0011530 [Actinidia rufa]
MKDGFGFVVYDFPTNVEKALRVLRGKNICGEPITLSWSNRQPRPLQRFSRGNRFYEMQHGREKHHNLGEVLPAEGNNVQRNLVVNDRWGERVGVPTTEIGIEGGLEFDCYEPYHDDDDRRKEDGNQQVTHSGGSRALRKSQENVERGKMGDAALNGTHDPKSHQIFYICGESDHKMCSCPRENASRRKMFSRFDCGRDDINFIDKGKGDTKRLASKSWRRPHLKYRCCMDESTRVMGRHLAQEGIKDCQ